MARCPAGTTVVSFPSDGRHRDQKPFWGILSVVVAGAWYANGRFTALETSMDWVKHMLLDLKESIDDANDKTDGARHQKVRLKRPNRSNNATNR
jgi:hypothetical protein